MATLPRESRYRHIFVEPNKELLYQDVRAIEVGDGNHIKVNTKYFCVATKGGGGPFLIHPIEKTGRISRTCPMIRYHQNEITDFDFCPLDEQCIASCSLDSTIRIKKFPEVIDKDITQEDIKLVGHSKKTTIIKWHPNSKGLLASASHDKCVKVWDVVGEVDELTIDLDNEDIIHSMEWNINGKYLATTCRNSKILLFDPRNPESAILSAESHGSSKMSRCFWADRWNFVGSVGFKKSARREIKFYDIRKMKNAAHTIDLDQQNSVFYTHFEDENSLLFLAGKGDSSVRAFELTDQPGFCHSLTEFKLSKPQKGIYFFPRRELNVNKAEILRMIRLLNDSIDTVSVRVPRKNAGTVFQEDLYPDCYAGKAAMTVDDYFEDKNVDPILVSQKPKSVQKTGTRRRRNRRNASKPSTEKPKEVKIPAKTDTIPVKKKKSVSKDTSSETKTLKDTISKLKKEMVENETKLNKKISTLESQCKELKNSKSKESSNTSKFENEIKNLKKKVKELQEEIKKKDEQISELNSKITEFQKQVDSDKESLAHKARKEKSYKKKSKKLAKQVLQLQSKIKELKGDGSNDDDSSSE